MATALGVQPSNAVLPVGTGYPSPAIGTVGDIKWPAPINWIYASGTNGMQIGPVRRTYRFWLCIGATIITKSTAAFERYDYMLRFIVNGSYNNDLNGIGFLQKCNASEGTSHADPWQSQSIEGKWYCEANTDYNVQLLTVSTTTTNIYYWQGAIHQNMWGYTVGEGVY
jgi:hypothetical protein